MGFFSRKDSTSEPARDERMTELGRNTRLRAGTATRRP